MWVILDRYQFKETPDTIQLPHYGDARLGDMSDYF